MPNLNHRATTRLYTTRHPKAHRLQAGGKTASEQKWNKTERVFVFLPANDVYRT